MKRIISILLIFCLTLAFSSPLLVTAKAENADRVPYAVEGGNIYFDPTTGTVVACDDTVTRAVIPSEINGVTVKALGNYAFMSGIPVDTLKAVELPEGLESIGSECFYYQAGLTEIVIPEGVTTIGFQAFFGCEGLKKVSLPSTLRSLGYLCFGVCTSLEELVLPEGLETLGEQCFYRCYALNKLNIPSTVTEIGGFILADTAYEQNPDNWVGGGLYLDNWLLQAKQDREALTVRLGTRGLAGVIAHEGTNIKQIYLPEGLKYISSHCFDGSNITSMVIPSTVEHIGERAFRYFSYASPLSLYFKGNAPVMDRQQFASMVYGQNDPRTVNIYRNANSTGWDQETLKECTFIDWDSPFFKMTDMAPNQWHYGAVSAMVDRGLMNGMSDTLFGPDKPMTRAMLVTVLWRYSGSPKGAENGFADIAQGLWYTDAVAWAAEKGIVNGVGDNRFDPEGMITREQLVTIIYRFATGSGVNTEARANLATYPDAEKVSTYALDAVQWAVAEGLLNGVQNSGITTLQPQGNATRAQVCAILQRYLERL